MNSRFFIGFVATVIFVVFYEWLLHGLYLADAYAATAELWRSPSSVNDFFPWLLAGQVLFSFIFCLLFTFTRCRANLKDGASYGLVIGLLMSSVSLINYAVMPISTNLMAAWFIGRVAESVLAGIIFTLIYNRTNLTDN